MPDPNPSAKTKSSPKRPGLASGGRKLSSLSSVRIAPYPLPPCIFPQCGPALPNEAEHSVMVQFQPKLSFAPAPAPPASSKTTTNGTHSKDNEDRQRMPPPPVGLRTKSSVQSSSRSSGSRGKSKEVVEVLSDAEEVEVLGESSRRSEQS